MSISYFIRKLKSKSKFDNSRMNKVTCRTCRLANGFQILNERVPLAKDHQGFLKKCVFLEQFFRDSLVIVITNCLKNL